MWAVQKGKTETVKTLLENRADINAKDSNYYYRNNTLFL